MKKVPWPWMERRRLLAQHLVDTTPRGKGENPIRAAAICTLVLVGIVVAGWLVGRGCG